MNAQVKTCESGSGTPKEKYRCDFRRTEQPSKKSGNTESIAGMTGEESETTSAVSIDNIHQIHDLWVLRRPPSRNSRFHNAGTKSVGNKYHYSNGDEYQDRILYRIVFENHHNKEDINIAENMFIDLLSGEIKERQTLNRQSLYFKKQERNFFLLSKWSNPKHRCQPECSLKFLLPEVVVYFSDTDEIKVAKKLRSL